MRAESLLTQSPAFDIHRESKRRMTATVGSTIKTTAEPTTWDERSSLDTTAALALMVDFLIVTNEKNKSHEGPRQRDVAWSGPHRPMQSRSRRKMKREVK